MRFKDKVAIVTGSGRGIGRATVLGFVKDGGKACITARTEADVLSVKAEVEAMGGEAIGVLCDVGNTEQVKRMIDETVKAFGRLDYVVNNAAGGSRSGGPQGILDCTEEDWQSTLNGTLTSVYRVSHYALPHIIKAGGGAIVNVSSTRGLSGRRGSIAYGAAKAGVNNLTRCMALDLLDHNVRVNCVCPGHVLNEHMKLTADCIQNPDKVDELLAPWPEDVQAKIRGRLEFYRDNPEQVVSILGRGFNGYPDDLANAILFLLSDEARFVNGEVVVVDGGSSAGK
jgi:NAD(P)-dependent dehydrogenase (short-subunit alcohol dehydrogenase family)